MKIDRKDLIAKVAEKHQLILTEDDPLIIAVTLNEVIFDHYNDFLSQKIASERVKDRMDFDQSLKLHEEVMRSLMRKNLNDVHQLISTIKENTEELFFKIENDRENSRLFMAICFAFSTFFFAANLWVFNR